MALELFFVEALLLPPNYSRCVAWGYADHSLRILPHDSERALMVCETPVNGEVLTSVCPTGKTVVTGGTNTVTKFVHKIPEILANSANYKLKSGRHGVGARQEAIVSAPAPVRLY